MYTGCLCPGARCSGLLLQKAPRLNPTEVTFFFQTNLNEPPFPWFLLPQQQLWHAYLEERYEAARHLRITDAAHLALNNTFERALVSMHKMRRSGSSTLTFLLNNKM